uniref:Uncharacterized protein n=1 Tax=Cacopsylla melanoneura TaxID=428564 RepID=A0A8D9E7G8_9HEMI
MKEPIIKSSIKSQLCHCHKCHSHHDLFNQLEVMFFNYMINSLSIYSSSSPSSCFLYLSIPHLLPLPVFSISLFPIFSLFLFSLPLFHIFFSLLSVPLFPLT